MDAEVGAWTPASSHGGGSVTLAGTMDREPGDEELMARYRDGDGAAFETLYARHRGALFRFVLRQCPSRPVAEELFQETWLALIAAHGRYQPSARFRTYLFHIAHNKLVDHFRRQPGFKLISSDQDDCGEAASVAADPRLEPQRQTESRQQGVRLLDALARLPQAQREVFLLREEGGLALEEIAQVTGVNLDTAKSRLRYAMAKLRDALQDLK